MAKAIMIQGTTSNAGKSLLAAGLCRIMRQDGLRVAPFKSQNMALNSYVTADGLEMGRAQVMQAQCAGIAPDVRMNPILLKPSSDTGSQVIVNGEVLGQMKAAEYYRYKNRLTEDVLRAYRSLAEEYDVIVLEGAGSPAEINLRDGDIVNMGMAKMAGAPVVLVGDINPGGVFAHLTGTIQLLEAEEQALIKGVVINKFRGDLEILRPGLSMLEEIIHRPVLGVVPYMQLDIDDEDSLSDRLAVRPAATAGCVDIAVIRLPRMSNFTDFAPLEGVAGACVRYVDSAARLGQPDLILLPGTKNTMGDLAWLRESGLEPAIMRHGEQGKPVMGICGGYQMLGTMLRDPEGVEQKGSVPGLGLLDMETTFLPQKRRGQVEGKVGYLTGMFAGLSGMPFQGYEIHMGRTKRGEASAPFCEITGREGARSDGMTCENIYGTYVHGIFDGAGIALEVVRALMKAKGMDPQTAQAADDPEAYREAQYDLLADTLRASLDMDSVYRIIEIGVESR